MEEFDPDDFEAMDEMAVHMREHMFASDLLRRVRTFDEAVEAYASLYAVYRTFVEYIERLTVVLAAIPDSREMVADELKKATVMQRGPGGLLSYTKVEEEESF